MRIIRIRMSLQEVAKMSSIRPGPSLEGDAGPSAVSRKSSPPAGTIDSARLLLGGNEVQIRHGAETYRLSVTRQNRLILTK